MIFAGDETTISAPMPDARQRRLRTKDSEFPGQWVQIDIDDAAENVDHLITAEDQWRIAMARH